MKKSAVPNLKEMNSADKKNVQGCKWAGFQQQIVKIQKKRVGYITCFNLHFRDRQREKGAGSGLAPEQRHSHLNK